jgi:hypothetical protein
MDLGTLIIGIICVVLCALPFILTNGNKKKKEKQLLLLLNNLTTKYKSTNTIHETFGYFAIGLDSNKKSVSYVLEQKEVVRQEFIALADILSCEVLNTSRNTKNGKIIDHLHLKLFTKDKKKPAILLEFYNSHINYQLNDELDAVEKWNTLINDLLNNNS